MATKNASPKIFAVFLDVSLSMYGNSRHLYTEWALAAVETLLQRAKQLGHQATGTPGAVTPMYLSAYMFGARPVDRFFDFLPMLLGAEEEPFSALQSLLPGVPDFHGKPDELTNPPLGLTFDETGAQITQIKEHALDYIKRRHSGTCNYGNVFANISALCTRWLQSADKVVVALITDSEFNMADTLPLRELLRDHAPNLAISIAFARSSERAQQPGATPIAEVRALASPIDNLPGQLPRFVREAVWMKHFPESQGHCFFSLQDQSDSLQHFISLIAGLKLDAFLSHAWQGGAYHKRVKAMADELRKHHVLSWLDEEHLQPGQAMWTRMEQGINSAHVFVMFITADYMVKAQSGNQDDYVQREVAHAAGCLRARTKNFHVLPVTLDPLSAAEHQSYVQFVKAMFPTDLMRSDNVDAPTLAQLVKDLINGP